MHLKGQPREEEMVVNLPKVRGTPWCVYPYFRSPSILTVREGQGVQVIDQADRPVDQRFPL